MSFLYFSGIKKAYSKYQEIQKFTHFESFKHAIYDLSLNIRTGLNLVFALSPRILQWNDCGLIRMILEFNDLLFSLKMKPLKSRAYFRLNEALGCDFWFTEPNWIFRLKYFNNCQCQWVVISWRNPTQKSDPWMLILIERKWNYSTWTLQFKLRYLN